MTKTILVADDDELTRGILRQHLELLDYRVTEAENGITAMEAIKTGNVDGVFLDILMPVSDGIEVLMWLKQEKLNLPAVVFSQADQKSTHNFLTTAERFGAIKSFSKPISKDTVHEAVALLEGAMNN